MLSKGVSSRTRSVFPPKRKIPRKHGCYRGYFPSKAMGDHLKYESRSVEKKLFRFLDFLFILGIVDSIYPQPFKIEYKAGRFYHPDALVIFRSSQLKPWIIEGKGADFNRVKLQALKPKIRAAIRFARRNGYIFHIVTSSHLCLIDDEILPFLKTHQGKCIPDVVRKKVLQVLKKHGPVTPGDLSRFCEFPIQQELVWRLAADGEIFCDLRLPPSKTSVAVPVQFSLSSLSRKKLFNLPFSLIRGRHD